jgi:epoxyqueuosine reductase
MMSSVIHSLVEALHRRAQEAGFCGIGFADAIPRPAPVFRDWLARGHQAGLRYLERHAPLREQPDLLLPGVKTILVAALPFPSGSTPTPGYAAYAQGADYHEVLRKKLVLLETLIRQSLPEVHTRIAVDSAPVAERDWALRAGIGWRGRQGQVIRADSGARLLLGEIFMTAQLPPSAPIENLCGECRLCLAACPTGALQADGTVDARRCLSYWTIEHRGPIPEEFREAIGDGLFGCDRCVAVCPWNDKATVPTPREFEPGEWPAPLACLDLDQPRFLALFRHSAVRRVKLEGLQRNALIVLSNSGTSEALPAITRFAETTTDSDLRELAGWVRKKITGST